MRIVEVPAGTVVVEVEDDPTAPEAMSAVVAWAAERAALRKCDLTLVHALAVEERFGSDPRVLREVVAALVEAGQELLASAHDEVRRVAPAVRVREVLRLVDSETALADLEPRAAEVVTASRNLVVTHRLRS